MSNCCTLCHLLSDDQTIDDGIKANARRQLSQVEGSGLTVDGFMGNNSSEDNQVEQQKPKRQRRFLHAPLLGYCDEVFRNHRGEKVQCRICGKNLTVRAKKKKKGLRLSCESLSTTIDHACVHLGKMIFACAHCDNEFACRGSVSSHLNREHKLCLQPSNYIDSSANYEKEILEMLNSCYNNAGSAPVISVATARVQNFRHSNAYPFSNFCRKLLKPNKDGKIPCSLCGRVLVFRGISAQNFISHAQAHLGKALFHCGQCDRTFFTRGAVRSHMFKSHVLSTCNENYTDMSRSYKKDTMAILERCFGQNNLVKSEPSEDPKRKPHSQVILNKDPLSNACRSLFAKLPLDAIVRCSLCGNEKKLYTRSSKCFISTIHFISHALLHLAKPMFKCRVCSRSTLTRTAMSHHLSRFHKISLSKVNFVDDSTKYQKEIIAMLEKCYDQAHTDVQVSAVAKKSEGREKAWIRSQAGPDTLVAERYIRCYELTRKFQNSGKVKCRVCLVEILYTTGMRHAITHLNKLMYRCRLCAYSSTTREAIRRHVKLTHGQSSRNQYDDQSNDFHAQILELISDCFDWGQESTNGKATEEDAKRSTGTCMITGKFLGNDLKADRLLHCHQLAQKFAQEGRVSCRICSASLMACVFSRKGNKQHHSRSLLNHATSHLKKVHRFKCKQCSETTNNRNAMSEHLKKVHKSSDTADCEDRSDTYHSEIMEILTKCFDWSQG